MCSRLSIGQDTSRKVTEVELGQSDVHTWLSLIDCGKRGRVDVAAEALRIIDMDFGGEAGRGYLSTCGQTGCTVIVAIQDVGSVGCWGYLNHVNSSMIEQGLEHASAAISRLPARNNIIFLIMGGPGGKGIYKEYLQRIIAQGDRWRFIVLIKPENGMEESVLCVENCSLALTQNLVEKARNDYRQLQGFQPERVPFELPVRVPWITGHHALDAQLNGDSQTEIWINLSVECNSPPEGMPDVSEQAAGVTWMGGGSNMFNLLKALAVQDGFEGLDADELAPLVKEYVASLPRR